MLTMKTKKDNQVMGNFMMRKVEQKAVEAGEDEDWREEFKLD